MREDLYAGIDAGGTRTRAVVAGADLRPVGRGAAGPANAATTPFPAVVEAIREALGDALEAAGLAPGAVRGICCGVAGVSASGLRDRLRASLDEAYGPGATLVTTDAEVALAGAGDGGPGGSGVVVIAGTGAIAFGRSPSGVEARAGGWGPLIGDEGSGYAIGREALSVVARDLDGRGPATLMRSLLVGAERTNGSAELLKSLYVSGAQPSDVAGYFPLVLAAARQGDEPALAILHGAGEQLALAVVTVVRKLGMENDAFRVSTVGGVFAAGELLLAPIRSRLREVAPRAALGPPTYPPEIGAVRLAIAADVRK